MAAAKQHQYNHGTGRRKSAVARVFIKSGKGEFTVNGKPFATYFVTEEQRIMAKSALMLTETAGSFNAVVTVNGGGVNGQAGAVRMGGGSQEGQLLQGAVQPPARQARRQESDLRRSRFDAHRSLPTC